jgi:2-polyprenyl-6-methoxyphenol hydroxylase-like FAD-dependent oxidoreductase
MMGVMMSKHTLGRRAVVIGSGMGGLFSATVLARHFDEVIVLDRDHEPTTADARGAVPQGHQFHVLLPGGLQAMCDWFPGFTDDLVAAGGVPMMFGRDFYAYTTLGKSYSIQAHVPDAFETGEYTYVQSRPQLELLVRRRVADLDNVSFRYRTLADRPLLDDTGNVAGVMIRGGEPIHADLVIDASGRNSLAAQWLPDMGYATAPETYVNCDITYASVVCEPENWDAFDGSVVFVMASEDGEHASRAGAVVKMPDGKWLLNLTGRYGDFPSKDWVAFRDFGRTLVHPFFDEMADTVTPVGDIKTYRMPRAVRHHYEQVERFPEGILPLGDAVCFFNPTHGQGMSSAAGQARGLQGLLAERAANAGGLTGLAMDFFPVAEEWVRGPWILAAMGDFANPKCTGDFPDADLPDLILLGDVAQLAATSPEAGAFVGSISTLRRPLSAIRDFSPA